MTAAVYRWFLGLSGADLIIVWVALCALSVIAIYGAVEACLHWWAWHKARRARTEADIIAQCGEGLR